jgi:predicted RNA binding protein YcfA (HicA-like mRNA interferase family)
MAAGIVNREIAKTNPLLLFQVKVRDVIDWIEDDGWFLVVTPGSHRQYKHPFKLGRVTVPGHPSDEMHPKTLRSILRQAQIREA